MTFVTTISEQHSPVTVRAALCIDSDAVDRFSRVIRHLTVGLIDQAIHLSLLSSDPRIEKLTLGPVQSHYHPPLSWPLRNRRIQKITEDLTHPEPPNIIHALSHGSYSLAQTLARTFDADLVLQVSSLDDCDRLMEIDAEQVGRYFAFTQPIVEILETRLGIHRDQIDLIRPGILVQREISCFSNPQRVVSLLCTSPLDRGSGLDRMIEAIAMLKQRDYEMLVFLLGQGREEDTLRQIVRDTGLSSNVTFVQPISDPVQAMCSADIYIIPQNETAFNANDLEAMGAGMAVVTFPSAISDYFHANETAMLCVQPTALALAEAIETFIKNADHAKKIATQAMEYAREHHAVSSMAEKTASAYRQLAWSHTTFSIQESTQAHGSS